ncbi:MAG: VCBS repeat-containing protein, partial [Deltaproteobacteria bacterium]
GHSPLDGCAEAFRRGSSWGTTFDANGDGLADLVVGAPGASANTGRAYAYLSTASGLPASPSTTLGGPDGANGNFGGALSSAGDVNGDGFADLLVAADSVDVFAGRVYVYPGGTAGLAASPALTLLAPDGAYGHFGSSVASAGDVNGDGFADVVVGARSAASLSGRAYLYLGSGAGLATLPALTLLPPDSMGSFGCSVTGAGDVNGDGFGDLAIGAYGVNSSVGRAYLYLGGAAGIGALPGVALVGPDGSYGNFGGSLAPADDVNGDGLADLVVGAYGVAMSAGRAYVYLGTASGVSSVPSVTLIAPDGAGGHFGTSVSGAGDSNGDGFADLVIGADGVGTSTGRVYRYLGSATGVSTAPWITFTGPDGTSGFFGGSVRSLGDVNGDGLADVAIGARGVATWTGRAYLSAGSSLAVAATTLTLVGPDGTNGSFGSAVASARVGTALPFVSFAHQRYPSQALLLD